MVHMPVATVSEAIISGVAILLYTSLGGTCIICIVSYSRCFFFSGTDLIRVAIVSNDFTKRHKLTQTRHCTYSVIMGMAWDCNITLIQLHD